MGGAARYGCLMGVVRFAKIMLPRPSFSLFTRRKLLCEAVWLASYTTEKWQKEIPAEENLR